MPNRTKSQAIESPAERDLWQRKDEARFVTDFADGLVYYTKPHEPWSDRRQQIKLFRRWCQRAEYLGGSNGR